MEFSAEDAQPLRPRLSVPGDRGCDRGRRDDDQRAGYVGYATPDEYAELFALAAWSGFRTATGVVWSVHCHDDLGLAVANSLAAVQVGARQVECTINGIGERAGNASLEEIVMALHTRRNYYGMQPRSIRPRSTAPAG